MPIPVLSEAELDALTEVCNIGLGHAATALSQLMGKGVSIEVPRLQMIDATALAELLDAQEVTCVHLAITGQVRGCMLILLRQENARRMLELLLGQAPATELSLSDLEISTLKEVGNILASACLNALGNMLKMPLLPSVPTLLSGEAAQVLAGIAELPKNGEGVIMIDTMFSISQALCDGSIFLMPAPASLGAILAALETP